MQGVNRQAFSRSRLKICCEQFSSNHRLRYSATKLIVTFSDGQPLLFGVIASTALGPNGRDMTADLTRLRVRRLPAIFLICQKIESTTRASVRNVPFVKPTKNSRTMPFLAEHGRVEDSAQADDQRVLTDSIVEPNSGIGSIPNRLRRSLTCDGPGFA
jgi:hypothetical protein